MGDRAVEALSARGLGRNTCFSHVALVSRFCERLARGALPGQRLLRVLALQGFGFQSRLGARDQRGLVGLRLGFRSFLIRLAFHALLNPPPRLLFFGFKCPGLLIQGGTLLSLLLVVRRRFSALASTAAWAWKS